MKVKISGKAQLSGITSMKDYVWKFDSWNYDTHAQEYITDSEDLKFVAPRTVNPKNIGAGGHRVPNDKN